MTRTHWLQGILAASIAAGGFFLAKESRSVMALLVDQSTISGSTFTVANFAGVKIVQRGSLTNTGLGLQSVGLAEPVNPDQAFLLFTSRHNSPHAPDQLVRGRLANANTVEFARITLSALPIEIEWTVVEYLEGVSVQRGEVQQSATTVDIPITPVLDTSQAFVTWSKTPAGLDTGWDSDDPVVMVLTANDNLQLRATTANTSHRIWWQVIEFTDPADILVQRGTTSLVGTGNVDIGLGTGVDLTKSFILVDYRTDGGGADVGAHMLRAAFVDANTIRIDRALLGDDDLVEIGWQVIELNDGSAVQAGSMTMGTGTGVATAGLATVDLDRAVPFGAVQAGAGQCMGRSNYAGASATGVGSATMTVTTNQLRAERENTAATTNIGWFVVEFAD